MAIDYKIRYRDGILKVTTKGADENLEEVLQYTNAIIEAAFKHQSRLILCDERELEYKLTTLDTYKLAEFASTYSNHIAKIVIVCNPRCLPEGKFYETVTTNRGLKVRVTTDIEEAEKWLNENQ